MRLIVIEIEVMRGDITKVKADAIVNPANPVCSMGGGVAKAILDRGGEQIKIEVDRHTPIDIGRAVATTAGNLPAKYIIHTPTVKTPTGKSNLDLIKKAVNAAISKAEELKVHSIVIPGLGTGSGGISYEKSVKTLHTELERRNPNLNITLIYKNPIHGKLLRKHFQPEKTENP
ncbi:MAG: macro domain-containing protein [Methanonatronarchaeia archaeon]|nr:MAG: macro domain-containing protein [Methanonatronarchaeia archaeon]